MALNFQLSMIIYIIVSIILMFVLVGFVLIFVVAVLDIIFCIIAAVKASEGKLWKYPLSITFVSVSK